MSVVRRRGLVPKSDFVGIEGIAHLCAGGETPFLKSNLTALERFALDKGGGYLGRRDGIYGVYRETKERMARVMQCTPGDLAFLLNAGHGINVIADAIDWRPGDNVVLSDYEYPSDVFPWAKQQAKGVAVRVVRHDKNWEFDLAAAVDRRTRVISVSHVAYLTGLRVDLAALSKLARSVGAMLICDWSHSLGVVPVEAPLCDFGVSCTYKHILGSHGIGVTYWNRERQPGFEPRDVGSHSVTGRTPLDERRPDYRLKDDAGRFECGNPAHPAVYVLHNSSQYILNIGVERIQEHVWDLGDRLLAGLEALGLEVMTPRDRSRRAGNICFWTDQFDAVRSGLEARGVYVWAEEGRVRISVHAWNDDADVDRCLKGIKEITGR